MPVLQARRNGHIQRAPIRQGQAPRCAECGIDEIDRQPVMRIAAALPEVSAAPGPEAVAEGRAEEALQVLRVDAGAAAIAGAAGGGILPTRAGRRLLIALGIDLAAVEPGSP